MNTKTSSALNALRSLIDQERDPFKLIPDGLGNFNVMVYAYDQTTMRMSAISVFCSSDRAKANAVWVDLNDIVLDRPALPHIYQTGSS